MPRAVASFIVCSIALLVLYLLGLGLYTQFSGSCRNCRRYSQRMNELVDNVAARVDDVEKRTYQVVIPKRFQDAPPPPGIPAPEIGRRKRGSKAGGTARGARSDSRSSHPHRADAAVDVSIRICSVVLRRLADGELRPVSGLFHAELARSHAPQLPLSVQRIGAASGGQELAGSGGHGAGLCDREFHSRLDACRHQLLVSFFRSASHIGRWSDR